MGMEMGFGLYHRQRMELGLEQRQALSHLLELSQKLRHEGFPEAIKGIEGLQAADEILKNRDLRGILIGGLSEDVCHPRKTNKDFEAHKDVDVLIPDMGDAEIGPLEGGIDWWLPVDAKLTVRYEASTVEGGLRYWQNNFGIRLAFGVDAPLAHTLPAGLYIPSGEFVRSMRTAEAMAQLDSRIAVDGDVEEVFAEKLEKRIKDDIAPSIKKRFGEQASYQSTHLFQVKPFDHETLVAVNGAQETDSIESLPYNKLEKPTDEMVERWLARIKELGVIGIKIVDELCDNETGEVLIPALRPITEAMVRTTLAHIRTLPGMGYLGNLGQTLHEFQEEFEKART